MGPELVDRFHRVDPCEVGGQRLGSGLLDGVDVHAGIEVVADLLLRRRCATGSGFAASCRMPQRYRWFSWWSFP